MMRPAVGLALPAYRQAPHCQRVGEEGVLAEQPPLTAVGAPAMKIAPSFPEGPAMGDRQAIGVGLLGLGTVGAEVYRLLQDGDALARAAGRPVVVKRVAVARPDRPRQVSVPAGVLGSNGVEIVTSAEIDIVVELIGGGGTNPKLPSRGRASGEILGGGHK